MSQISTAEKPDSQPANLFRIGGVAALISAGFAILQITIEVIGVGFMQIPMPATIDGWFMILQSHPLLGLTALTMFQIPAFILCVPMFLALFYALKRTHGAHVLISTTLAFLGMAIYLASNTVFSLLSLSGQYQAAATDAQRQILLAAGQAMLTFYEGSGVDIGLFVFMVAVMLISGIMLQNSVFSRATAYFGILAGVVSLLYYAASSFYSNAIFILEAAGVFFVTWVILVGRRLIQLNRAGKYASIGLGGS